MRIRYQSIRVLLVAAITAFHLAGCRKQTPVAVPLQPPAPMPKSDSAPRIPFVNIFDESGVAYESRSGASGEKLLPESGGSGVAIYDYDNDGDSDLLLLSGDSWPWDRAEGETSYATVKLYRNDGAKFVDVSQEANLNLSFYAQGVAVGDYDGDGDQDLFLTGVGECHLLRNDNGVYSDITSESGIGSLSNEWTTSTGFFDHST